MSNEKVHIIEGKKLRLKLKPLTLEEAQFIESSWHHACISAYNLSPTKDNKYNNLQFNADDIQDIIKAFGIHPPKKTQELDNDIKRIINYIPFG
jgi:hypothetical protein